MDIEQAIETIYTGLVSEESVPVKLRAFRELDREMLGQVQEALSFAIEYYKGKSLVPKKLAMAMVDIFGAFCFNSGFSEKEYDYQVILQLLLIMYIILELEELIGGKLKLENHKDWDATNSIQT